MGSGKKAKGKKGQKGKQKAQPTRKLLRTEFMDDFERTFIFDPSLPHGEGVSDGRVLWPPQNFADKDAAQEFTDLVQVMSALMARQPVTGASPPTTFRDRVIEFLDQHKWPKKSPVPKKYEKDKGMVHLVEVAVICDRMLQAWNAGGPDGGGGPKWPPHTP